MLCLQIGFKINKTTGLGAPISIAFVPFSFPLFLCLEYFTLILPNFSPPQIKRNEEATENMRGSRKILKGISDLCFHL